MSRQDKVRQQQREDTLVKLVLDARKRFCQN